MQQSLALHGKRDKNVVALFFDMRSCGLEVDRCGRARKMQRARRCDRCGEFPVALQRGDFTIGRGNGLRTIFRLDAIHFPKKHCAVVFPRVTAPSGEGTAVASPFLIGTNKSGRSLHLETHAKTIHLQAEGVFFGKKTSRWVKASNSGMERIKDHHALLGGIAGAIDQFALARPAGDSRECGACFAHRKAAVFFIGGPPVTTPATVQTRVGRKQALRGIFRFEVEFGLSAVEVVDPVAIEIAIAESFVGAALLRFVVRFQTQIGAQWRGVVRPSHHGGDSEALEHEHTANEKSTNHHEHAGNGTTRAMFSENG